MKAIRKSSSSSSDSEDNEELNRLRAAVDPEFQKFVTKNGNDKKFTEDSKTKEVKKSKRAVISTEWEAGHFVHPLKLTRESQDFVAKQLSVALDNKIKAVDTVAESKEDEDSGILLFRESTRKLRGKDLTKAEHKRKRRKPVIKKEKEGSSSDEDKKLKAVAVSADWVLNPGTV